MCTKYGNIDETVGVALTIVEQRRRTDDRASVLEKRHLNNLRQDDSSSCVLQGVQSDLRVSPPHGLATYVDEVP